MKPSFACDSLTNSIRELNPAFSQLDTLRNCQVAALVAIGTTTSEIAVILGISPKTADKHRQNLMKKHGLRCTSDVTMWALRHRLVKNKFSK